MLVYAERSGGRAFPEDHDIIRTATESRMYDIALPFLAGMDEIDRVDPEQLRQLSEPQMRRALAFYYFTPTGRAEEPAWYGRWVKEAPTVVADVMIRSAMSAIRAGKEPAPFRYGLAYELRDAEIGRLVSLPLLRGFPVRCKSEQLSTLDHLLWAALRHADRASFRKLIDMKLSRKSMGVSQRVHWLSAGLMLSPDEYRQPLEDLSEDMTTGAGSWPRSAVRRGSRTSGLTITFRPWRMVSIHQLLSFSSS